MQEGISRVHVELAERSYEITIGYDIIPECIAQLPNLTGSQKIYIISDANVEKLHGAKLHKQLGEAGYEALSFIVQPGEEAKSWQQAGLILEDMLKKNLERKTPVLALGGGVVGDLAGFVAALYRRGAPLIQIPTTLLGQVDSSVGGKVAVNHPLGKNMFGTFYQPAGVWADLSMLGTLEPREWSAGLAEVIKYAVIKDPDLFLFLEEHKNEILARDKRYLPAVIKRCCQIKADIVGCDERDEGLRNILNFGHTFGHALESATSYRKYRHGEAVAVGTAVILELAVLLGMLGPAERDRVIALLEHWQLPTCFPAKLSEAVLENLIYDKKVSGSELSLIIPLSIGRVVRKAGIPANLLQSALQKRAK